MHEDGCGEVVEFRPDGVEGGVAERDVVIDTSDCKTVCVQVVRRADDFFHGSSRVCRWAARRP